MLNEHRCELIKTSELSFTERQTASAETFFNTWITISEIHPLCKGYLISLSALNRERTYHKNLKKWWIVHPFSKIRFLWETIMTIVYAAVFLIQPFVLCFVIFDFDAIRYDYYSPFLHVFFWIDILATSITGFYDSVSDEFILEQSKIFKSYLSSFFLIDILTSLPYDQLTSRWRKVPKQMAGPDYLIGLINLVPLLKLFRYVTFRAYVQQTFLYFNVEGVRCQWIVTLIFYFYFIHWSTCFYNLTPWFIFVRREEVDLDKNTWLFQPGLGIFHRYHRALFIVLENLSSSGYGGIKPATTIHLLICSALMLIGRLFECYIITMLLQIVFDKNASKSKYEETINQLSAYSSQKQLPSFMKHRLLVYYHFRFRNSYFREKRILSTLSDELRQEVILHSCRRLVENVEIFQDLPRTVLVQIVSQLKPELYLSKDMIIKAGTQGDCMFFLSSGTVVILTPTGREVCFLEDGAHFGEVALLVQDQRRVASVVAVEVCEVYRLDRKEFRKCIAVHSDLFAKIERVATERMHRTLLIEEEHKRLQTKTPASLPKTEFLDE